MKNLNYRMSQNDVPDIALKVYKISSRKFFDGRHQTERILDSQAAGQKKPVSTAAKASDEFPAAREGPIIKIDDEFMKYVVENN